MREWMKRFLVDWVMGWRGSWKLTIIGWLIDFAVIGIILYSLPYMFATKDACEKCDVILLCRAGVQMRNPDACKNIMENQTVPLPNFTMVTPTTPKV